MVGHKECCPSSLAAAAGGRQLAQRLCRQLPLKTTHVDRALILLLPGWPFPFGTDCSVCSDGYSEKLGFTCSKCSKDSAVGIVVAAILSIAALFAAVCVVWYLISGEAGLSAGQGVIGFLTRYIPLQSVKIVIVAWQILTQVSRTYEHIFRAYARVNFPWCT